MHNSNRFGIASFGCFWLRSEKTQMITSCYLLFRFPTAYFIFSSLTISNQNGLVAEADGRKLVTDSDGTKLEIGKEDVSCSSLFLIKAHSIVSSITNFLVSTEHYFSLLLCSSLPAILLPSHSYSKVEWSSSMIYLVVFVGPNPMGLICL
jgi:hypothetical protein